MDQETPVHIRGQEGDHQSQIGEATFTSPLALHTWDTFDIMLGHVVLWWSQRQVETVKQQAHHEALPSHKQEGGHNRPRTLNTAIFGKECEASCSSRDDLIWTAIL
ncbi:hypothetical protein Q7C36_022829 [Tachysurus vachellii]|uniref:Uncharacterized protein n=1 Tax=Tachysurus vachellii TaxID=175792 RepID=A0AA88IVK9_TACVA|nr:hypothetical protein Q7C36_022829 [Tachysurus vachellii]